ncbi:MAG: hypothetical protein Q7K16_01085 [Candidatus Azambacteria bacterium]|nr:hypothetical protein [Candidatus Azambacteria bacterium]
MAKKKTAGKMTPAELNKSNYNKRVYEEIIKPIKQAAERAFKECGLKDKVKIVVIKSNNAEHANKKKPKIDIKKIAEGLGAEIITDPTEIAKIKKKKYLWRPE